MFVWRGEREEAKIKNTTIKLRLIRSSCPSDSDSVPRSSHKVKLLTLSLSLQDY